MALTTSQEKPINENAALLQNDARKFVVALRLTKTGAKRKKVSDPKRFQAIKHSHAEPQN